MSEPLKPIAVVGMSAEFPSGTLSDSNFDHQSFFDFLLSGKDAAERVPKDRFNIDGWQGTHLGQVFAEEACFLKNVQNFDHFEFGISSKDALTMGLATRKLVEHSFLALLDAGINSRSQNVGAYTSGIAFDLLSAADADEWDVRDGFGGGAAAVANRVSYQLDLLGPSIPVDTACSSSLMALHLGIQALRTGDCEAAVIGGSQINHRFLDWIFYSQLSILSPAGRSTLSWTWLFVSIESLQVLNTAINSTGSAGPVKTPIPESQAAAMHTAFKGIGRSPAEVDFVECHATGTAVGDPIEANWVGSHFKKENAELVVGSVKGNIGHTEITSFLSSFTKVCGMFKTNTIPPQANYSKPNPAIHWEEYNMRVPTTIEEFKTQHSSGKRLVSINASGLLGANGHVIVESPPPKAAQPTPLAKGRPVLLMAGGLSPRSATAIATDLAGLASDIPNELPALSNIFGRRARQLTWRSAAVSTAGKPFVFPAPRFVTRGAPPLVYVFSGQGPQHIEMGRQLFKFYPAFRDSILRMDKIHVEIAGTSIVNELGFFADARPKEALPDTWPVTLTVPSIAMIQMALVDLLAEFGVRPSMVFGHSAGEAAMSYASGALPQALAMEIAIRRSRAMKMVEGSGGMAAVSCTPPVAREIIRGVLLEAGPGDVLELGCYNAPEAVTISGTQGMLDKAIAVAQKRGMFARQIKAKVPGHCSLLEPCKDRYVSEMEEAFACYPGAHVPTVPTYSTQTGQRWEQAFTPEYMWNNGRVPVQFEQTVTTVVNEMPEAVFIEVGPHPALSSYISGMGAKADKVICPMRRTKNVTEFNEVTDLLLCVGNLCSLGVNTINFNAVNATDCLEISKPIPAYPFAPKAMPFYSENSRMAAKQKRTRKGPLNYDTLGMNALTHPDLAEHVIKGEPIMPTTGFFEMMFEEGARTMWDIELRSLLPLLPEKVLDVQVKSDGHAWSIVSSQGLGRNPRLHASGFMTTEVLDKDLGPIDLSAIRSRCTPADISNLYAILSSTAAFGPLYRRVEAIYEGDHEILYQVRGNAPELTAHYKYIFHPSVLDACIHGLLHPVFTGNADKSVFYLPSHIGRVMLYDRAVEEGMPETLYSYVVPHSWTPESVACDAFIVNEKGERLVTLINCVLSKHWAGAVPTRPETSYESIYQPLALPIAELAVPVLKQRDYAFLDELIPSAEAERKVPNGHANGHANGHVNGHVGNGHANGHVVAHVSPEERKAFEDVVKSITSDVVEAKPSTVLSLFPSSLEASVASVRQVLDHAVKSGKQVVRLLDIGDATGSLYKVLLGVASEYPSLRLDYTACGHEHASPDVRKASFNVDSVTKQAGLTSNTYDLIVETHTLGFASELDHSLEYLNTLLVPGGFLVGIEVNGIPQARGGKWVDLVFSPHGQWFGLRSGKQHRRWTPSEWDAQLSKANFSAVDGSVGVESSLFLILRAQKPSLPLISPSAAPSSNAEKPIIFSFEYARALDFQQVALGAMSSSSGGAPTKIWIEATMDTFDGAVATGFARSLMRELVAVEIRLALFDASWTPESRIAAIEQLSALNSLEAEVALNKAGVALVPRFRSYAPRNLDTLDHSKYWAVESSSTVVQCAPPLPGPNQVLVQISSLSGTEGGLQGLVGTVTRTRSSQWQVGARVVAVVPSARSNFIVVHEGQISEIAKTVDEKSAANLALLLVFAALGLRLDSRPLKSLKQIQAVVLHTGTFAASVARVLEHLGVKAVLVSPSLPLILPRLSAGDIIIGGLPADSARTVPKMNGISVFNWIDSEQGALAAVVQNPWLVGTTLEAHLSRTLSAINLESRALTPVQLLPPTFEVSQTLTLADDKFYLVVGGIGSLGLQIAIWMYRKGARHIALTSRTGVARLAGPKNRSLRGAVDYLQSLPDLDLRLEACDATSVEALTKLVSSLDHPLAGCVFSAAVLADRLFLKQDAESFPVPFKPKTDAYFALEKVVALDKLDFLLAISSVASFGAAGQTNYASANTAIQYLTARYPNAWAFVSPGIADSNVGFDLFTSANSHIEMWETSTYNSYEICLCLEDGLLRMANGERISVYIPNLNWDAIYTSVSESPLYNHLVKIDAMQEDVEVEDPYQVLQEIVLKFVDASEDEFERNVPLTSYGLDSLSAARMSTALKPYMSITQIQLLGDLSLEDLVGRMQTTKQTVSTDEPVVATAERPFAWDALHQPGQTVLKLTIGSGTPLIILHGGAGDVVAFRATQEQFSTPLWAIQPTPEAPLETVDTLAQFYFEKIKEARPAGPYRIAGFSASSMVTLRLAQLLEANEDEIVQLTFVDHHPMVFTSPLHGFTADVQTFDDLNMYGRKASVGMVADCCSRDSAPARRTYGDNLVAASEGRPSAANALESWEWIKKTTEMNLRQVVELGGGWEAWSKADPKIREETARQRMVEEIAKVRAPINALISNWGLRSLLGLDWGDLGVAHSKRETKVTYFESGHFDIFEKADFARALEFDWVVEQPKHELATMVHNPAMKDLRVMWKIVDTMALRVMADTLKQNPRVGTEISRQRLFHVTEEFVRTQTQSTWTDEELERSKKLFPLYFETTERISKVHPAIMESPAAAVGALYSDDMMDGFYRENPVFTSMNQEASKYFKSLVSSPDFGKQRPIRVLEVGAGVGGLTKFLVEALCDMPNADVEYTVTDLSYALASSLAQSFTYKNMVAKMYDLGKTPTEQGLQLGHYDIITGLNVIHAVSELDATLRDLHTLLAPGGRLLFVDTDGTARSSNPPRPGAIWNDFIWGSFQGWMGYTDDRPHCTIDERQWRDRLTATGYSNVKICHEDAGTCIMFEAEKV
ncbi:polyketide synthase [Favolaschia claudopus]|uniref:Polyketide synthase n=1 Tax=Favolaschia claudopus TaxID=2862362 RepID=A0AAW0E1Y0_9AGAR